MERKIKLEESYNIVSILNVLVCLILILIGLYNYVRWKLTFWKNEGIPYVEYKFPFGSAKNPLTRHATVAEEFQAHYNDFKSQGYKYGGLYSFGKPVFLPVHPECVKAIMLTDFRHFMDHGSYYNEKAEPLSANLFNLEGNRWKNLRQKLTSTFTTGKMKTMFNTLISCSDPLVTAVNKSVENEEEINMKENLACFTTDTILSCAFGIDSDSFNENKNYFRRYGRIFFTPLTKFESLKDSIAFTFPALARYLGISILKKETTDFFFRAMKKTIALREKTSFNNNDLLQILINLKNDVDENKNSSFQGIKRHKLTLEEIAAQAFVFFGAAFENPANAMTFCLLELALNQEIQDKVRKEVLDVLANNSGKFTYAFMMETTYLSQVIDETLRKYPPVPALPRVCVKNYKIPNTNFIIKKGVRVLIPTFALHRDPEFFPDPEKFDPERFNETNKLKIPSFSYLPFGEGPRKCIGFRFALMQLKVGLSVLLKHFRFTINEKTTLPLKFNENSFILLPKDDIWLNVEKIY